MKYTGDNDKTGYEDEHFLTLLNITLGGISPPLSQKDKSNKPKKNISEIFINDNKRSADSSVES